MRLIPAGPCEVELRGTDLECFRDRLRKSDTISFALFGFRVGTNPGAKVREKAARALAPLMPLPIREFYSAKTWLGTSSGPSLIVLMKLSEKLRSRLRDSDTPFPSWGKLEDLALYSADRVLLWTCTHEKEAYACGSDSDFVRFGLRCRSARLPLPSGVEPLDSDSKEEILRLASLLCRN